MNSNQTIVVLIITKNRPDFLSLRSLPSVLLQTKNPDSIVLVDDSDDGEVKKKNKKIITGLPTSIQRIVLENSRTPGAAGAWNTGIEYICHNFDNPWIALLDDDDEWDSKHLETCMKYAQNTDAVISGIQTIKNGTALDWNKPSLFEISHFFAGNPGWQGSNTFIKVSFLHKVGGFDENLLCTHDRDLAIRCLATPGFRYVLTDRKSVHYYLDDNREALTGYNSFTKTTGLLQFFKKYYREMSYDIQQAFIKRAVQYFGVNADLFLLIVQNIKDYPGFGQSPVIKASSSLFFLLKFKYALFTTFSHIRRSYFFTFILGYAFKRSHKKIEIDITYNCNLKCINCNRCCRQASETMNIEVLKVRNFVQQSIKRNIEWQRIRVMGGEPTLHPDFTKILYTLIDYKLKYPRTRLEVVTNGYGRKVQRMLSGIPPFFNIENSRKESQVQEFFEPFNHAPRDSWFYRFYNFRNGCSNLQECGLGLTPLGYYPCALAGAIDRVVKMELARKEIPDDSDTMSDVLAYACSLCGRFRTGIFVPYTLRSTLKKEIISKSWQRIFKNWKPNET